MSPDRLKTTSVPSGDHPPCRPSALDRAGLALPAPIGSRGRLGSCMIPRRRPSPPTEDDAHQFPEHLSHRHQARSTSQLKMPVVWPSFQWRFRPQLPTWRADSTRSVPAPPVGTQAGCPWSRSPRHRAHMQLALRTSSGNRLTWPSSQVMVTGPWGVFRLWRPVVWRPVRDPSAGVRDVRRTASSGPRCAPEGRDAL
jgi:hypothetical protein